MKKKLWVNSKNTVLFKFLRQIGKCKLQTDSLKKKVKKKEVWHSRSSFQKKTALFFQRVRGGHFAFPDQARFAGLFLGQIWTFFEFAHHLHYLNEEVWRFLAFLVSRSSRYVTQNNFATNGCSQNTSPDLESLWNSALDWGFGS